MSEWTRGFWAMIGVCVTWGLSPIFYRALSSVSVGGVLAHRTIWSLVLFVIVLHAQGRLQELRAALTGRHVGRIAFAAVTVSINWGLFIWAVQFGHVVQSSLGYYIFPLVAVLFGVVLFGERLAPAQVVAVAVAVLAVALLTWGLGVTPWISLGLAVSFGLYGVAKKTLPLDSVVSVAAEVALLTPLALAWLAAQALGLLPETLAPPGLGIDSLWIAGLLLFSGVITGVPLMLFSYAAHRVEMATLGLMLYLNPTLQFILAVLLFGEAFSGWHMLAFAMIWGALAIYSASAMRQARRALALANG